MISSAMRACVTSKCVLGSSRMPVSIIVLGILSPDVPRVFKIARVLTTL